MEGMMKYTNPVIKGFYPDPSVCFANGKYYLASSSFQYFPGVPIFESDDLINWRQIGYAITRSSQVKLDGVPSSGGIFAPTIRFHEGRFYMITNNNSANENYYIYTDDIYGDWSEPVVVEQDGIDPSLLFDEGHVYFISNGSDADGKGVINQCEIDVTSGRKLTDTRPIWQGTGGRYLESPHMYHIGDWYYLMAAEGGTEYGHMVTCARSRSVWGPFESCPGNPVLTNRNKAPYIIQGIGHGDLIEREDGEWFLVTLGFRQIHLWYPFHHLGREVFLTPVKFGEDGWFTAGVDGTTDESYEIQACDGAKVEKSTEVNQDSKRVGTLTFANMDWNIDWCYMRIPVYDNYVLEKDRAVLKGSPVTLYEAKSPTFIALRQRDFDMELSIKVRLYAVDESESEGGITIYQTENEHYDLFVAKTDTGYAAVLRLNLGGIKHIESICSLESDEAHFIIRADAMGYHFFVETDDEKVELGYGKSQFLSSEVCGGFTGVMIGLYAVGECKTEFCDFNLKY